MTARKIMEHMPTIKSWMTPFPYRIDAGASLDEATAMMQEHDVHHLPVREGESLVGVLHRGAVDQAIAAGSKETTIVREVEVGQAVCFDLSEPMDRVLQVMAESRVDCVLVVKQDKLAGIFTFTDACRCFADFLLSIFPSKDGNDAA